MGTYRWLLDLELAGRVYRYSTHRLLVTDQAGRVWRYAAGLEDPAPVESVGDEDRTSAITIRGTRGGVDWAGLVAQGVDLAGAVATLRRWEEGTDLEAALLWQTGDVVSPEYGSRQDGLTFSLERRAWDDDALVPSRDQVVDDSTWPARGAAPTYEIDDVVYGSAYPIVIGYPGYVQALEGTAAAPITPGPPAYLVDYTLGAAAHYQSVLMIAGHEVKATYVRIYDLSDGVSETRPVQHTTDNLGRKIAYVDFQGAVTIRPTLGHEYRSAHSASTGGGLPNRKRTAPVRGAGELVRQLLEGHSIELEQGTVQVDVGRMEAQRPYLDRVLVDTWISEGVHPWQWVVEYLLPILPADVVLGEEGLYLRAWDDLADTSRVVAHLDADKRQVVRDGTILIDTSYMCTEFVLDYCYATVTGQYLLQERVGAEGSPQSHLCRLARSRLHGRTRLWEATSDVVSDQASAAYIVRQQVQHRTRARRTVAYVGGAALETLRVGDLVAVTDSDVHLTRHLARVLTLGRGATPAVELELRDEGPQTSRRTS